MIHKCYLDETIPDLIRWPKVYVELDRSAYLSRPSYEDVVLALSSSEVKYNHKGH